MIMNVISPENMRQLERYAVDVLKIDELTLMENAAHGLACELIGIVNSIEGTEVSVAMLAGTGNNGGDVVATARMLLDGSHGLITNKKIEIILYLVGDSNKLSPACRTNFDRLREVTANENDMAFDFKVFAQDMVEEFEEKLVSSNIIVDGIFGIGLSRPAVGEHKTVIDTINRAKLINDTIKVVAVDVPSGLEAYSGVGLQSVVKADITITMQATKTGMLMNDGPDLVGEIREVSIFKPYCEMNCDEEGVLKGFCDVETSHDTSGLYSKFLDRKMNTNKGSYGKILCICGSDEMRGAAAFAAKAAFAIGSGLVYVATTKSVWNSCSVTCPEAVGMILKENSFGGIDGFAEENLNKIKQKLTEVDAVLVGPGMMNDAEGNTAKIVECVLNNSSVPVVVDADGLNATANNDIYTNSTCPAIVVTPHPGEMGRLMNCTIPEVQSDRIGVATEFTNRSKTITLLKGCGTVVAHEDKIYINTTGGPALAVAGSGDLLAGIMVGLIAQYSKLALKVYNEKDTRRGLRQITYCAVKTSAYLHGLLGDFATADKNIGNITAVPLKLLEKMSCVLESEKENVSNE